MWRDGFAVVASKDDEQQLLSPSAKGNSDRTFGCMNLGLGCVLKETKVTPSGLAFKSPSRISGIRFCGTPLGTGELSVFLSISSLRASGSGLRFRV